MKYHRIEIEDTGDVISARAGTTLIQSLRKAGVDIECSCGGKGKCGTCKVRVLERDSLFKTNGVLTDSEKSLLTEDERKSSIRLACQKRVDHDMAISVVNDTRTAHTVTEFAPARTEKANPGIRKQFLRIKPSDYRDISDSELVLENLEFPQTRFSLTALRSLPEALRTTQEGVTVTIADDMVVSIEPGDTTQQLYGVAVDLGTTTIVCYLVDLLTGEILGSRFVRNPQHRYGASVIDRIEFANRSRESLVQLSRAVTASISKCISAFCKQAGVEQEHVYRVAVVGNTTMLQLLLRLDPKAIGERPYVSTLSRGNSFRAAEVGLHINEHAELSTLPIISGFVGSDAVAAAVACGFHRNSSPQLLVDLGTNSEIVLSAGGKLWTCSAAAGPAFEGAGIEHGVVARAGAICQVMINHVNVEVHTIDNAPARGICGSGLVSAVAQLLSQKLLDHTGRFTPENCSSPPMRARFHRAHTGWQFLLSSLDKRKKRIHITQRDIRNIQLAKGAVRAGIEILLRKAEVWPRDLQKVFLAGSFGSSLDIESVLKLGILPPLPAERVSIAGNAAGSGAVKALLNKDLRKKCEDVAREVNRMDLGGTSDFQMLFMKYMYFQPFGG